MSTISNFYAGKSILVTGATGFIGKVLIEKLLYSCPNIDKIYLLIRGAKGKSPHERMIDMISQKPFNFRLKADIIKEKLVAVDSDLAKRQLGLSQESRIILINQVSIIFHVAASVKFEAPLEVNMRHNVVATKELLEFACLFQRLLCFVHVSTAYSNCQLRQIDERIYPMEVPDDPMSLQVTKSMIDNRPNTYTYTKAMAENVASKYAGRINVVIVRPSIVMSALKEPIEGWVDTINGPVGLSVLGALGILQKIRVNSEVVFDLIPVDVVTNALVSIAWAATERKAAFLPGSSPTLAESPRTTDANNNISNFNNKPTKEPMLANSCSVKPAIAKRIEAFEAGQARVSARAPTTVAGNSMVQEMNARNLDGTVRVFNLTTGKENPCSFYHYFSTGREEAYRKPSSRALRPLLTIPKQKGMNSIQYWIHKIFSHLLFAYVVDMLLGLFGRKTMVVKAVNRMHHANEMFDYFCSNQWNFVTDNMKKLIELQTGPDKETFNCDVRAINWSDYARIGWIGCRRFILNEPDDTFDYAKQRYRAICLLYYLVKVLLLLAITSVAGYCLSSPIVTWAILLPTYAIVYLI